jgi:hypothetical protein
MQICWCKRAQAETSSRRPCGPGRHFGQRSAKALAVTVLSQLRGRLSLSWVHLLGRLVSTTNRPHIFGTCFWTFESSRARHSEALVTPNRLRDQRDLIKQCDNSRLRFLLLPPRVTCLRRRDHIGQPWCPYTYQSTIRCVLEKGSEDVKNFSGMLVVGRWFSLTLTTSRQDIRQILAAPLPIR